MWLFSPDNCFRTHIANTIKKGQFEGFILLLIAISSILLALDNPLNNPDSYLVYVLGISDIVLTSFFIFEAFLKIIAHGFLINGENSYLRIGWNIIDFAVVITSTLSIIMDG